ncbi:rRNA maturation RNase YbeY [Anaerosacchariphilus polymeriproducens]|uniref:Endoribonuclease YbeY n=1 Tax=Anaerosacchariphilus polymeriproducens TaxID=1812858 RepID=A0A371AU36_9FIRM|nr:rRNA maturation RNase YbeY [Anaerosacchariphilus polymeriproducens]RDU23075.1 rRNA maturation RNase YbeY [Anaerosacchariphilus polymeriproducens]
MTIDIENESNLTIFNDYEKMAVGVIEKVLDFEDCPYEVEVELLLTTNEGIQKINNEFRHIDKPTDVLSFPLIEYATPSDFSEIETKVEENFNLETGELLLGDIIISVPKMIEQAEEYGHSLEREFSFLITHSMLHLLGYDHMEKNDAVIMEGKQKQILDELKIFREYKEKNDEEL